MSAPGQGRRPRAAARPRRTQAERRETSRSALLESAARELSRHGYTNLVMERVARAAGYTRGAIYHQFPSKQELALAVIPWLVEAWRRDVAPQIEQGDGAAKALLRLAGGYARMCRRDIARAPLALRVEFSGRPEHPVGRAVEASYRVLLRRCAELIAAGRADGSIPAGPPPALVALAFVGALEGTVIATAGRRPHDEALAIRAAAGVLGLHGGGGGGPSRQG